MSLIGYSLKGSLGNWYPVLVKNLGNGWSPRLARTIINVTVKKCHKLHHFESFFVVENLGSQPIVAGCTYKIGSGHARKDEQITMCAVPVSAQRVGFFSIGSGRVGY